MNGCGHGILDAVAHQDVVTFTGSAATGRKLKAHPRLLEESVPFNMEADSLNACVLGEDAVPGTADFDLFIKEVHREMTVKAGQKCTAVRRILVPASLVDEVRTALVGRLKKTSIGDPSIEGVRMGALATRTQVERVSEAVDKLSEQQEMVYGPLSDFELQEAVGSTVHSSRPCCSKTASHLKIHWCTRWKPLARFQPSFPTTIWRKPHN